MNRRIAALSILTITACPQDDAPPADGGDEVESSSTDGPDLPGDDSTESESSSTDTGESTESDSSSEESTSEEDSTDGETGSEAVPTSLIVESDGQRIGYLMSVWDYGFTVWDDVNEVSFQVNQQTGHVVGAQSGGYFTTPDCTGQRYELAIYVPSTTCNQTPAPTRRFVRGDNVLIGGHEAPPQLIAASGEPTMINALSTLGQNCSALVIPVCAYPVQVTNVIPKTFALPITVSEAVALP